MADETTTTETPEATPEATTEQPKRKRVRIDDLEFARICNEVANDETFQGSSYIKEVAKRTGLQENSVQQKRNSFNKKFKAQGIKLPAFPRGGRAGANLDETAQKLREMNLVTEAKAESQTENQ